MPPHDLPPQPAVFAPDYAPEEIAEIAQKLRKAAGLPDEPPGVVANGDEGVVARSRTSSADWNTHGVPAGGGGDAVALPLGAYSSPSLMSSATRSLNGLSLS